jgi:hypothetical protein
MRTINLHSTLKEYSKKNIEYQVCEEDKAEAYSLSKALQGEYATYFFGANS